MPSCLGLSPLTFSFGTELQNLAADLLIALRNLPAARLLPSKKGHSSLQLDILQLLSAVARGGPDIDCILPLLRAVLANSPDTEIWERVFDAVTELTPAPRPTASSLQETPLLRNTSSFANSSEHRKYVEDILREELGQLYVGLRGFHDAYFGGVAGLEAASEAFYKECLEGRDPLFDNGWRGWPRDANQDDVLVWFTAFVERLTSFAESRETATARRRRLLAKLNRPVGGSTAPPKVDIVFINNLPAKTGSRCHLSQILAPGELKSNASADRASEAWFDLGRYAREVLAAQDTRRFVLGFTLCGARMRIWEFDRLGGSRPTSSTSARTACGSYRQSSDFCG